MFCVSCGREIPDDARFCTHCGATVVDVPDSKPVREQDFIPEPPGVYDKGPVRRRPLGMVVVVLAIAVIAIVAAFIFVKTTADTQDKPQTVGIEADYGETVEKPGASNSGDSAEAAKPGFTHLVDTGDFSIVWPDGRTQPFDVETTESGVVISCGGAPVAQVNVATQATEKYSDERKHRVYSLKPAGGGEGLTVQFFYHNADGRPAHWGDATATELGIERLAGMSPEELLALFALPGAGEPGGFEVTLVGDDLASGGSAGAGQQAQADAGAAASGEPFWGIWAEASKSESEAEGYAADWRARGFSAEVVLTTDWSNLNPEPWYCVTLGRYASESAAQSALANAQSAGSGDAYVKYSGEHK